MKVSSISYCTNNNKKKHTSINFGIKSKLASEIVPKKLDALNSAKKIVEMSKVTMKSLTSKIDIVKSIATLMISGYTFSECQRIFELGEKEKRGRFYYDPKVVFAVTKSKPFEMGLSAYDVEDIVENITNMSNNFDEDAYNYTISLAKKFPNLDDINRLVYRCYNHDSNKLIKELFKYPLALNEKYGIELDDIASIMLTINRRNSNPKSKDLDKLFKIGEEGLCEGDAYDFIRDRIICCYSNDGLNQKMYDFYNKLYSKLEKNYTYTLKNIALKAFNLFKYQNLDTRNFVLDKIDKFNLGVVITAFSYVDKDTIGLVDKVLKTLIVDEQACKTDIIEQQKKTINILFQDGFLKEFIVNEYLELCEYFKSDLVGNKLKNKSIAEALSYCFVDNKLCKQAYEYLKENLVNNEETLFNLQYCKNKNGAVDLKIREKINYLLNNGIAMKYATQLGSKDNTDEILDIRQTLINNKGELTAFSENSAIEHIDGHLFYDVNDLSKVVNILGKKAFIHMYEHYEKGSIRNFRRLILSEPKFNEYLTQIINPTKSEKYKSLEDCISKEKNNLKCCKNEDQKKACIAKINSLSADKNKLIKDSIKDPKEGFEFAILYSSAVEYLNLDVMKNFEKEAESDFEMAKTNLQKELMKKASSVEDRGWQEKLKNLYKNHYFVQIFASNSDFKNSFDDLCSSINNIKSTEFSFNNLIQNRRTKKLFEKYKLNFENWKNFNPNSKVILKFSLKTDKLKENVLKNFEADFNDVFFEDLPLKEYGKINKALEKSGYYFEIKTAANHDTDGYLESMGNYKRIYKDGKPIEFDDLKQILKILKEEFKTNDFWTKKNEDEKIEGLKETFKDHIMNLRYNEVKYSSTNRDSVEADITIQKADMNDIVHSLFLGNYSSCCTAIGSFKSWTAPNYIKNKMISAIEVYDGNKAIGNTMIFCIEVDGKPALFLDNIELKPKYQFNQNIEDGIIEYAKKLAVELGQPNMGIYAGQNRHKVGFNNYEQKEIEFKFIGDTNNDEVYIDSLTDNIPVNPDEKYYSKLYTIRK